MTYGDTTRIRIHQHFCGRFVMQDWASSCVVLVLETDGCVELWEAVVTVGTRQYSEQVRVQMVGGGKS